MTRCTARTGRRSRRSCSLRACGQRGPVASTLLGRDLSAYHRVRRARNAGDYREEHDAVADDILADHPGCQKIVDIAKRVVGQMPPL